MCVRVLVFCCELFVGIVVAGYAEVQSISSPRMFAALAPALKECTDEKRNTLVLQLLKLTRKMRPCNELHAVIVEHIQINTQAASGLPEPTGAIAQIFPVDYKSEATWEPSDECEWWYSASSGTLDSWRRHRAAIQAAKVKAAEKAASAARHKVAKEAAAAKRAKVLEEQRVASKIPEQRSKKARLSQPSVKYLKTTVLEPVSSIELLPMAPPLMPSYLEEPQCVHDDDAICPLSLDPADTKHAETELPIVTPLHGLKTTRLESSDDETELPKVALTPCPLLSYEPVTAEHADEPPTFTMKHLTAVKWAEPKCNIEGFEAVSIIDESTNVAKRELLTPPYYSNNLSYNDTQLETDNESTPHPPLDLNLCQPPTLPSDMPAPVSTLSHKDAKSKSIRVKPMGNQPKFCQECGFQHVWFPKFCGACGAEQSESNSNE